MNMKQVWGVAGGFFVAYLLITVTNKPGVEPGARRDGDARPAAEEPVAAAAFQPGFCYPGVGAGSFRDARSDSALAALAQSGARWVAITPLLFQASGSASAIEEGAPETPGAAETAHAIRRSHELGLKVMLRPVVTARDGTRREDFVPFEPQAWFDSYRRALAPYVEVAAQEGVALLCLGSSYTKLEESLPWDALISETRGRYSGQLTYGATFAGGGYARVPFWQALDYVGIDAVQASAGEAIATWREAASAIGAWHQGQAGAKPVLFTSIGFPQGDEQTSAYQAFFSSMAGQPWLAGTYGYYWNNPAAALGSTAYGMQDQPALQVVASFYARGAEAPPSPDTLSF